MDSWGTSGVLDRDTLQRLVHTEKLTDQQIADMYEVAESTVRYWRQKTKVARDRAGVVDHRGTGALPWKLNTALGHHTDPMARLLRTRSRMKAGLEVPADAARRVAELEDSLREMGRVLDYDRVSGFKSVPRRGTDDPADIVRKPGTV